MLYKAIIHILFNRVPVAVVHQAGRCSSLGDLGLLLVRQTHIELSLWAEILTKETEGYFVGQPEVLLSIKYTAFHILQSIQSIR